MSVWNKAYEDFRRPYYEEEKKAKKDYDGDGKVESGSKEHAGAVHNAIQRAKGGKADGQDTRKEEAVAEGSMKQARKNVGADTCWKGYKAKGTKMKDGRVVPNCVKEEDLEEGIRDKDPEKGTEERKARLEKKRGMKLDDHPQYKKEGFELDEADSLAAMQARREKRLAAQRKREGTTASGRDFGHDYSLSDKQQKARRDAEFKAGLEKRKTKKEEVETLEEKKKGLYANIHAKRARGEAPAKPGDEDYPAKDAFKKAAKTAKKEHYDWRADFDFVIEKKSDDCGCDHTPKKGVKNKVTVMPEVKTEETELQEGPYIITKPDITGNTPAYRNFKAGMKSKVTGKPMYKLAPGVKLPEETEEVVEGKGMHRDAKTGEVVDKAEIGKTYYPNFPKRKTSVALRKEKERKEEVELDEAPYQVYGSPDGKKEKKIGKPVKSRKYADARAAELADTHKATGGKYRSQKEDVEFAGNYEGPLYAPHPDLAQENLQSTVDSLTKKAQGALQSIGVKINKTPRPTARPSAQTQNTMRQNKMSNEEAVSEGKKKKDDSYLETNMKKRHANNEKARKDMEKMGTKMKNPHFEETILDKVIKCYVSEEDYDRMKDRRQERGGVAGNVDYKRAPKNNTNKFGKGKTAMQKELEKKHGKGKSAMDIVRAEIQKKHGKGAIMDKKKKDN